MNGDLIIDPALITQDNMPQVLGAIVIELRRMNTKIDEKMAGVKEVTEKRLDSCEERLGDIEETIGNPLSECMTRRERDEKRLTDVETTLAEHDRILWAPLRLTSKQIVPFLWKSKGLILGSMTFITLWFALIDWAVRAAQWALQPPIRLP